MSRNGRCPLDLSPGVLGPATRSFVSVILGLASCTRLFPLVFLLLLCFWSLFLHERLLGTRDERGLKALMLVLAIGVEQGQGIALHGAQRHLRGFQRARRTASSPPLFSSVLPTVPEQAGA